MSTYPRLLGDIGGTNARFAWQAAAGGALDKVTAYPCADFPSLLDAMRHYIDAHPNLAPRPRWCAIGIANPVIGDHVQMTNHRWSFSTAEMQRALGLDRLLVINDFTALALALPFLPPSGLHQIAGRAGQAAPGPLGLIGPGTGLGVSGLLPAREGRKALPIAGEGGHVTLAPTSPLEDAVVAKLRRRYGHVSAERALSGPGLQNLYVALCDIDGVPARTLSPAEIAAHARAGTNPQCLQALDLFFGFLGNVAGNLALSLGARGGIYVGGGIVPRLLDLIVRSRFAGQFVDKGRFRGYLEAIPIFVVEASASPALLGAARALEDL